MKDYINFYFNKEGNFNAEIHKNGKHKVITNEKNLLKLLEISNKHGYKIKHEGTLSKGAKQIIKEFDKYQERKQRLKVLGNILTNMKVSRKNPLIGKTLVTASILAVVSINGLDMKKQVNNSTENISFNQSQVQILDDVEKLDTNPVVEESQEINVESNSKDELNKMFENPSFHYSYEDRSNKQSFSNAKRYEDIFEKYANRYGLDKNLLMAMAAQESSGDHYNNLGDKNKAAGIMQIEKAIHIGNTVQAYNFETGKVETIKVTPEKLKDIDSNIQIGSMILRQYIENCNYNIPLAIQTYNMGPGNMSKVLNTCSNLEKVEINTMRNNPTNNKWLNYRSYLNLGDSKYVEHVFSYLNNTNLKVLKRNNEEVKVAITNDYSNINQL